MKEWKEYSLTERLKVWGVVGICVVIIMWGIGYGGIEGYEMDMFEACVYKCESEENSDCNNKCLDEWDAIEAYKANAQMILNELRALADEAATQKRRNKMKDRSLK